jgi:hypothetical protein
MLETMKTKNLLRVSGALACVLLAFSTTSCMTTYDAAGRPMQTVDPVVAMAGVAAAGVAAYAIGQNSNNGYYSGGYRGYGGGYHRPHYGGGYYRPHRY